MANLIHDELINGLGEEVVGDDGAEGVAYEGEIVSRRLYLAREMMVPKEWPTGHVSERSWTCPGHVGDDGASGQRSRRRR